MARFLPFPKPWFFAIGLLGLAALGIGLFLPSPRMPAPRLLDFPPHSSRRAIAGQLSQAGVVRHAAAFELWSLLHPARTLKAGTYEFAGGAGVAAVFDQIAAGRIFAITVTVPEGFNRFDIARLLAADGLASENAFLQATADPAAVRDLDPAAVSLEGYLFPDTYRFSPFTTPAGVARIMVTRFRLFLRSHPEWKALPPARLHEIVTLASLVERETPVPGERALIAGVFENRLRAQRPLQCDPTVVYAALLAGRYSGSLHRADLSFDSPYNTYLYPGLPPGPIANPGALSIAAAASPAATADFYFVSDGHGAHRFARTLAEHNRNVQLYLRGLSHGH